jgi:hypothetical protein
MVSMIVSSLIVSIIVVILSQIDGASHHEYKARRVPATTVSVSGGAQSQAGVRSQRTRRMSSAARKVMPIGYGL